MAAIIDHKIRLHQLKSARRPTRITRGSPACSYPIAMKSAFLLAALCLAFPVSANAEVRAPDIRVSASATSAGTERPNKSTKVSKRILKIQIENRDQAPIKDLDVHWMMIARDVNSRKLSIAAQGHSKVSLDRVERREIESRTASFTEKEGVVKRTGKGKNKRTTAGPDTGTRYGGYLVQVRHQGKMVAQAGTSGMAERFGD